MGDERANPRWGYCPHAGCWVGEYWCCQGEGCQYSCWPEAMEVANSGAYDATGYNGDDPDGGSVADCENGLDNRTARYGGEWQSNYQPSHQRGDVCQDGVQRSETNWHNAGQYDSHEYDNEYDDDQQNGAHQHDVGRYGSYYQNYQRTTSPSEAWATTGSGSNAGQTNSPNSTENLDNDTISMAGNADEDWTRLHVEEQRAVGMNTWSGQDIDIRAVGQFENSFPEYRYGDAPYQREPYPRKFSFSDESETGVDQANVEERPVLRPR